MKYFLVFLIFFSLSFASLSKDEVDKPKNNFHVHVGGGFISKPTYLGSSSRRFFWFPAVFLNYQDKDKNYLNSFEIFGPQANLTIIDNNRFSFDLVGEYDFGRQSGDDNSLTLLEDIDSSYQTGVDFEYKLPYNFSLGTEVVTGVKDFGDQIEADFFLSYSHYIWITFDQIFVNKTSLSYQYGNSDFMNEWFGTPANQKYTLYKPSSGFYGLTLANKLISPITERISIVLDVDYQRLIGEAADSRLVEIQGSPNQYSIMFVGIFELYSF